MGFLVTGVNILCGFENRWSVTLRSLLYVGIRWLYGGRGPGSCVRLNVHVFFYLGRCCSGCAFLISARPSFVVFLVVFGPLTNSFGLVPAAL